MKIGDLVRIVRPAHPWAGFSGVIVGQVPDIVLAGRRWVVQLDGSRTETRAGDRDLHLISDQLSLEGDVMARGP